MTALCAGGTSGPKAGYASVVDFSVGLIGNVLAARGLRWLIPAVPLAGVPAQTLSSFCGTDPPAVPTFTTDETTAILTLSFGADFDSGISKLRDLILYSLWYEVCECTSGTLTAYPTITPPTDTPIFQPPGPIAVTPCTGAAIIGPYPIPAGGGPTFVGFVHGSYGFNVTIGILTVDIQASTGNFNITVQVRQQTVDASVTGHTYSFTLGVGTSVRTVTYDPLYPQWAIYLVGAAGTGQRLVDVKADLYCDGQVPGGAQSPCCPPDDTTQAYLDLILQSVTLIQRQSVPFAYVYGADHAGLSDDGSFSVSGLMGISVDVTTLPDSYGRADGTPEQLFDLGYVSMGTADGWLPLRRIDHDGTLWIPTGAGALTIVGYSLSPGVVVSIRELVREP
jgi:hypothetical protein